MKIKTKIFVAFSFALMGITMISSFASAAPIYDKKTCATLGFPEAFVIVLDTPTTTPAAGSSTTATSAMSFCCCDAKKTEQLKQFISGQQVIKECPPGLGCARLNIDAQSFEQLRASLTGVPDASGKIPNGQSPLETMSIFVSRWYAAAFYIAVVAAVLQIFRGGFEYAIAAGNSSKTEEAKSIIIEAVIGLGVALLAAGILVFLRGPQVFVFS